MNDDATEDIYIALIVKSFRLGSYEERMSLGIEDKLV